MKKMKRKYAEYRINIIEIEGRPDYGEWHSIARFQGQSVVAAKTPKKLVSQLMFWIKNVVFVEEYVALKGTKEK